MRRAYLGLVEIPPILRWIVVAVVLLGCLLVARRVFRTAEAVFVEGG